MLNSLSPQIGLSLFGVIALFCIISAIIGLCRGFKKTLGSTVVIVISAVISFIVTLLLCRPSQDKLTVITNSLMSSMQGDEYAELISSPAVLDMINYYVAFIIAPFFFVLLFFLVRIILGIVMKILVKKIPVLNNIPKPAKRLGGTGLGIVNGFLLAVIFMMPLLGMMDVANVVVSDVAKNEEIAKIEIANTGLDVADISESLDSAVNDGGANVLLKAGGRALHKGLTSAEYNGEKVSIRSEAEVFSGMAANAVTAVKSEDTYEKVDGIFSALIYGVDNSDMIKSAVAEVVPKAANAWQNGEEFIGVSKSEVLPADMGSDGYDINPMIDTLIGILANETSETISADLNSISRFIVEIGKSGMLNGNIDMDGLIESLSKEGTLSGMLGTLDGNENMIPLIDEMNRTCVRLVAAPGCLNLPKDSDSASSADIASVDDIITHMVSYKNIPAADRHNESIRIEQVMIKMAGSYDDIADVKHASELMAVMGEVLDAMNETVVYGTRSASDDDSATAIFLIAVMQSESVSSSIGLDAAQMREFADTINKGSRESSYNEISVTVANSFDVLENINSGVSSEADVEKLMSNLTPTTAGVMKDIVTPDLMKNYGVNDENAEKSSNAVGSLLGNMAAYTENHPIREGETQEEYDNRVKEEAKASDKIINLAIKANENKDTKQPLFTTESGTGSLDMDAYGVVDTFIMSTVATDTVNDLVMGTDETEGSFDPLGIQNSLNDGDKTEITNALDQYREDNKDNSDIEDLDGKLANIGAMFGIVYNPAN